ncbi:phosphodiesterase [Bradyrhizobium elkanii]|uniref:phosphodiesterase n=1 Tax=Bradyrhizobium elkanii TaxID=29448 RepID=UPI002013409F|nr:phosphodiesterase [Bradyrhizobium elkanii]
MKLIHMSDIHLTTPGRTIFGRDPMQNFERAGSGACRSPRRRADGDLGDLSGIGELADYHLPRERLNGFSIPVRLCIGNHDHRERCLSLFPKCADPDGFAQGVHDTSFGRCLLLDTYDLQTAAGSFCPARQAWLERQRMTARSSCSCITIYSRPASRRWTGSACSMMQVPIDRHEAPEQDQALLLSLPHRAGRFGAGVPMTLAAPTHDSYSVFAEVLTVADLPDSYGTFVGDDYVTVHMVEFGYRGEIIREDHSS